MCNPRPPDSTSPPPSDDSAEPANALYVELATRITTQRLHYHSGDEETAAESIHSLFKTTRELMTKHSKAREFQYTALALLNGLLRPYTARWRRQDPQGRQAGPQAEGCTSAEKIPGGVASASAAAAWLPQGV